jgi:hypothetical protein
MCLVLAQPHVALQDIHLLVNRASVAVSRTSVEVNNVVQHARTKACAKMLALYVYNGCCRKLVACASGRL